MIPDDFRFTAKFPRTVTYERDFLNWIVKNFNIFFDVMGPVRRKLLAILLQLRPSTFAKEGVKKLKALIHMPDQDLRYALKVRNTSWSDKSVYKLLSDNNICLAWSQLDPIQTPPELTSDFLYLLVIGDRSINEKLWYSGKNSAVRAEKVIRGGQ